ncbi:MAG TPA: T9SS type A sorting domain-containing protein [Chitinophagaceae bacterium]
MKPKSTSGLLRLLIALAIVLLAAVDVAEAQLPDCASGNIVYAVFNRDAVSTTADSTEIRPVNVTTGAVGALMGGRKYWIRKRRTPTSSTYYHGTSGLGVDLITSRFYAITQMGSDLGIGKDIHTINTLTGTQQVIGTTPASVNDHHFVKLAISNNGYGYTIGVARDTSLVSANNYNPLVRFTTCGAPMPVAPCSTIELLGYLPNTALSYKSKLYNGDIAFDIFNNMYFVTVAFDPVGSNMKYTHARLFRVNAADIPSSAGTGIIPMSFIADYNSLDTTVINGIAFDGVGNMLIASRIFDNTNTNPSGPYDPVLFHSATPGSATQLGGFSSPTPNFNVADMASCYFPMMILGYNTLTLKYKYENGKVNLRWQIKSNPETISFEVQRSNTGIDEDFETIGTLSPAQIENYTFSDPQNGFDKNKYYRIKQVMSSGVRYYSNVVHVSFNNRFNLIGNLGPNPFNTHIDAKLWMRTPNAVNVRIFDQNGRTVYTKQFAGKTGDNKFTLDNLSSFKPGVYIVELAVQEEVIREKIIRQ